MGRLPYHRASHPPAPNAEQVFEKESGVTISTPFHNVEYLFILTLPGLYLQSRLRQGRNLETRLK
jgi:hypothetical protein